jgi:uncharacterized protein YlaI
MRWEICEYYKEQLGDEYKSKRIRWKICEDCKEQLEMNTNQKG